MSKETNSETMWKKLVARWLKLPEGKRSESVLNHLLLPWFSGYWIFPNPKFKGEEIADALLLWGDVLFIIQIKTRKGIKSDIKWAENKISEEKARIAKWIDRLKSEESIILRNKFREIEFPRDKVKYYYGLVVLNHHSDPYDANEFLYKGNEPLDIPIQVISLVDIHQLLRYINTPWDLVIYFESRSRLSHKTSLKVHQEDVAFSMNLEHIYHESAYDIGKDEADKCNEFMDVTIKAINGNLKEGDPGLRQYAVSFLIDASIGGQLNRAPKDKKGNFIIDNKFVMLTKAVEVLSEMSRLRRAFYGEIFLKQAEIALNTGNDEYEVGRSTKRGISYGFLATSKSGKELEDFLGPIAMSTLADHGNYEGIFIAAPPENVFSLYQTFSGWFTGDKGGFLLPTEIETLQSTILYIDLH